jgi:hypothetical protein
MQPPHKWLRLLCGSERLMTHMSLVGHKGTHVDKWACLWWMLLPFQVITSGGKLRHCNVFPPGQVSHATMWTCLAPHDKEQMEQMPGSVWCPWARQDGRRAGQHQCCVYIVYSASTAAPQQHPWASITPQSMPSSPAVLASTRWPVQFSWPDCCQSNSQPCLSHAYH